MSKSRKKFAIPMDTPKGTWRHEYNGKLRSKSKQLLNQVIDGKIDPDELILPTQDTEGEIWVSPKENSQIWDFKFQDTFLDEIEETAYYERLERYEKSFRK